MAHDFSRPDAPARTKLEAPDDWELQILETPHWHSDTVTALSSLTAMLLCPDGADMPASTDHLQHEFHDTTWISTRLEQGTQRIEQLVHALPREATHFPLVIHVGLVSPETADEIERTIQRLRQTHASVSVIVCCDYPDIRERIRSADGFVCHPLKTTCREILQFAAMLHGALATPASFTASDLEDVKLALGTAMKPALLGEAIRWHGTDHLMVSPQMAPELLRQATSVFVVFYVSAIRPLSTMKELYFRLREHLGPDTQLILSHSCDFDRSVLLQGNWDRIRFCLN